MKWTVIVLAVASCVPKTATEQAKYAADGNGVIGDVDGSLQPIGKDGEIAGSEQASRDFQLSLQGISNGRLCVRMRDLVPILFDEKASQVRAQLELRASKTIIAVGAYESLGTFQDWPDRRTAVPGTLISAEEKNHPYKDHDGDSHDSYYLHYVIEWCAPVPAIAATTKFITATKWPGRDAPAALFVWRIKGTPTPTAPMAPTAPAAPAAPTETAPKPAPATPSEGTVLEALRRDGHFDKFLQIAAAGGKEQALAKGGLIVIAPFDNAISSTTFDAIVADKQRASTLFDDSVIDGTLTKQQLVEKKTVTLTARSGRTVVLGFDEKSKRPTVDGAKLDRLIFEGSTWTVFTTYRVTIP